MVKSVLWLGTQKFGKIQRDIGKFREVFLFTQNFEERKGRGMLQGQTTLGPKAQSLGPPRPFRVSEPSVGCTSRHPRLQLLLHRASARSWCSHSLLGPQPSAMYFGGFFIKERKHSSEGLYKITYFKLCLNINFIQPPNTYTYNRHWKHKFRKIILLCLFHSDIFCSFLPRFWIAGQDLPNYLYSQSLVGCNSQFDKHRVRGSWCTSWYCQNEHSHLMPDLSWVFSNFLF